METERRGGMPWIVAGAVTLLALGVGASAAALLPERYRGADIVVRPWMGTTSAGVDALVGVALFAGAWAARGLAGGLWILGGLAALVHAALPPVAGAGPWAPDGAMVRTLTALTVAPAALRALGALVAGAGLAGAQRKAVLGLAAADLAVVCLVAAEGATAVMARAHPADPRPLLLLPAAACAVALAIRR